MKVIKIDNIDDIERIKDSGFLYVKIPENIISLQDAVMKYAEQFFMKPDEDKNTYELDDNFNGYYQMGRKSSTGHTSNNELLTYSPKYKYNNDSLDKYYSAVSNFAREISRRIIKNYMTPDKLEGIINPGYNTLSLIRYREDKSKDIGMDEHTDWGLVTLVYTNGPGLQIKVNDTWHDVPPIDGYFIINIGDITNEITNKEYMSTKHRVLLDGKKITLALFFEPNTECRFVINGKSMNFGEYLQTKYPERDGN